MAKEQKYHPLDLNLQLSSFQDTLKTKTQEGKTKIWDPLRKKWLVLTPEEHVRQLLIQYLLRSEIIEKNLISVERQIMVNGVQKRFDLLIYNESGHPIILIECKAPNVDITQSVFDQISYYNVALSVPYLMVTNGRKTYFCSIDHENRRFEFLEEFKI